LAVFPVDLLFIFRGISGGLYRLIFNTNTLYSLNNLLSNEKTTPYLGAYYPDCSSIMQQGYQPLRSS